MHVFHGELTYEEGFKLFSQPTPQGFFLRDQRVVTSSGWGFYSNFNGEEIRCAICNRLADRWVAVKWQGGNQKIPIVELFGGHIWFSRDHIIPRSLGGVDHQDNLRPCCSECNVRRGNTMAHADYRFLELNPRLFNLHLYKTSRNRAHAAAARHSNQAERERMLKPFEDMDDFLAARPQLGISCKIKTTPHQGKKVISLDEKWVHVTNLFHIAKINAKNMTTRYQQIDGRFVGPFVKEKDYASIT